MSSTCPKGQFCISHGIILVCVVLIVISCVYFYFAFFDKQYVKQSSTARSSYSSSSHSQQEEPIQSTRLNVNIVNPTASTTQLTDIYDLTRYRRFYDPLTYPEKSYITRGMPINIPTRGYNPEPQQLGVLTNKTNDKILPLFGNPTYPGSSKWYYYTATDKFNSLKLQVSKKGRNCTAEFGCDELYEDDEITVPSYNEMFKVSIYPNDVPRYIPF